MLPRLIPVIFLAYNIYCLNALDQPFQATVDYLSKTTDLTKNPCTDFYEYACGNYKKNFPNTSAIETIINGTNRLIVKLIKQDASPQELRPVKIAKDFFKKCVKAAATVDNTDKKAFQEVLEDFKSITGISFPAFDNNKADKCSPIPDAAQLGRAIGKLMEGKPAQSVSFLPFLATIMKSPKRGEDAYGFAFVLSPVFCHSNQSDPLQLAPLTNFFDDWNKAGGNISETTITNTINSTKKFINEMLKKLCVKDIGRVKETLTTKEANSTLKTVDIGEFLQQYTINSSQQVKDKVFADDFKINCDIGYFGAFDSFLTNSSKVCGEDLANLLYLQLISYHFHKRVNAKHIGNYLYHSSKESTHLNNAFGLNSDQQEKTDDVSEERCRLSLKQYMPDVLDRLFIIEQSHKYNLTAVREKIGQMTHYVLQGFQSMVEQVTWMSPKSRKAAEKKIKNLTVNLLHQKNATDDTTLLNTYNNLEFNPSWSLRMMKSSMQQFAFQQTLESLLQTKFDREKLACDATDVNAFYAPEANSINIPLAILQPIVFSPTWPDEYIFGSIGLVLGHEISHGFDNGGVNYDEEGYLNPWLEPQTQQAFDEMGKCLADEYSKFCNPKENRCLDGTYTLGENIADNAGIHASFRGFHHMIDTVGKPQGLPQGQGPLSQLKEDQLFFLGFAQFWCDANAEHINPVDSHSPAKFRVIGTVPNFPGFSNAFGCAKKKHCDIWITPLMHKTFMNKFEQIN